jgi:hypothetical protein
VGYATVHLKYHLFMCKEFNGITEKAEGSMLCRAGQENAQAKFCAKQVIYL